MKNLLFALTLSVAMAFALNQAFGVEVQIIQTHDGNGGGGGGTDCDLCVVKNRRGEIVFSCKYMKGHTCSKSSVLGSVSCSNARECS